MNSTGPLSAESTMAEAIAYLVKSRTAFAKAVEKKQILGNDNHIGDVGEYWVSEYYKREGQFLEYAKSKNAAYDMKLRNETNISVKTVTGWSRTGYGTQIKPLCGSKWSVLAAVKLNAELRPEKIAIIDLADIMKQDVFIENEARRKQKGTKSFPRFQWWDWLEPYVVYHDKS